MTELITVMHLRATNFIGGPEKQILEHFARLDSTLFRPLLGTFVEDGISDPLGKAASDLGFKCVQMYSVSPLNPSSIYSLLRVLKQEKVSILCTHGYKPNILGCLSAAIARIPNITISRGWTWESPKIRFYEAIDRFFLRLSDHVVAVSAGQQDKILDCGIKPEKVSVIHNAINLMDIVSAGNNSLRSFLGLPADALIVASAGRLSPEKNYATMIEAAREVVVNNGKVFFVIFGEGFLRAELEKKIVSAGLAGRFLLPGFNKNLQTIMHEIDIFMLPSFSEGLPNVVLEAFAARKPVVATAVGGTPEVVQDGISGYLTKPDQPRLMAKHILALLEDNGACRQMGDAGYEYAKNNFDFAAQTSAYELLYMQRYQANKRRC